MYAHEIIPGIWLGDKNAATDPNFLNGKHVQAIFNCTKDIEPEPLRNGLWKGAHYRVPIDDSLREEDINNLAQWSLEVVYNMMREYNAGHVILVHCYAGRQRSAACVAMFLIALTRMSANDAMKFIQSKRLVAFEPRPNFEQSIRYFEFQAINHIFPKVARPAPSSGFLV